MFDAHADGGVIVSQAHELTLFDDVEYLERPAIDLAAFDAATDHPLDDHSSITHVHGLIRGHEALMRDMCVLPGWEQRRRWMFDRMVDEPRLTNEYKNVDEAPRFLIDIADALSDFCGVRYDRLWMNWYRDNRDSTSWPLFGPPPRRRPEYVVCAAGGGRPDHARTLSARLATQRPETADTRRSADKSEFQ
jgi:hypothetical protein